MSRLEAESLQRSPNPQRRGGWISAPIILASHLGLYWHLHYQRGARSEQQQEQKMAGATERKKSVGLCIGVKPWTNNISTVGLLRYLFIAIFSHRSSRKATIYSILKRVPVYTITTGKLFQLENWLEKFPVDQFYFPSYVSYSKAFRYVYVKISYSQQPC